MNQKYDRKREDGGKRGAKERVRAQGSYAEGLKREPKREGAPRVARPVKSPVPPARRVLEPDEAHTFIPRASEPPENILAGRNPIREALRSGRSIDKLAVLKGELSGSAKEIIALAREKNVIVQYVEKAKLDEIYLKHQGMIAYCAPVAYAEISDILRRAEERGEQPFVVLLDGITDPHNMGAIIRTAECAGAHGVIIPERRSATLNPAAAKAAAGALEYMPIARETNLVRALEELKRAGLWAVGGTMDGEDATSFDYSGAIALVIGAEGDGISQLVKKTLDKSVTLPLFGKIESLNASVAAGVLMFNIAAARHS